MENKKCPICDVNYLKRDEELCTVCNAKANVSSKGRLVRIARRLLIKKMADSYLVYDDFDNLIGEVLEIFDCGKSIAEIKFIDKYNTEYSYYHRLQDCLGTIPFAQFESLLRQNNGEYLYIGDVKTRQ